MEWETTIHHNYIEIVTHGIADKEKSLEMAKTITKMMRRNKSTRVLIDHRDLKAVSGTTIDVYERPTIFRIIGIILGIRIGEVIKPDHQEHFRFLETVCRNRGFQFSIFFEKGQAVKWLFA